MKNPIAIGAGLLALSLAAPAGASPDFARISSRLLRLSGRPVRPGGEWTRLPSGMPRRPRAGPPRRRRQRQRALSALPLRGRAVSKWLRGPERAAARAAPDMGTQARDPRTGGRPRTGPARRRARRQGHGPREGPRGHGELRISQRRGDADGPDDRRDLLQSGDPRMHSAVPRERPRRRRPRDRIASEVPLRGASEASACAASAAAVKTVIETILRLHDHRFVLAAEGVQRFGEQPGPPASSTGDLSQALCLVQQGVDSPSARASDGRPSASRALPRRVRIAAASEWSRPSEVSQIASARS